MAQSERLSAIAANGSRRHYQLPRRRDGGEGRAPKGDELWSWKEVFDLLDVATRERALRGRAGRSHGDADPAPAGKVTMNRSDNADRTRKTLISR
jgi:hypothetical protein